MSSKNNISNHPKPIFMANIGISSDKVCNTFYTHRLFMVNNPLTHKYSACAKSINDSSN